MPKSRWVSKAGDRLDAADQDREMKARSPNLRFLHIYIYISQCLLAVMLLYCIELYYTPHAADASQRKLGKALELFVFFTPLKGPEMRPSIIELSDNENSTFSIIRSRNFRTQRRLYSRFLRTEFFNNEKTCLRISRTPHRSLRRQLGVRTFSMRSVAGRSPVGRQSVASRSPWRPTC